MAVVNATPDSFSDGGRFFAPQHAITAVYKASAQGAHIIDIGAESTRPDALPIDAATEQARLRPVLAAIAGKTNSLISVDTYKSSTAALSLQLGAHIINDVHGLQGDPAMAQVVAHHKALVCVMHGALPYAASHNIVADVQHFWQTSANIALRAGVPQSHIAFDIGVGFGKTDAQLWQLLHALPVLVAAVAPCAVLVGASRKSFLGRLLGQPQPAKRLHATLAVHALAWQAGARIVRGHDTRPHLDALQVLQATRRAI